jgi:haloacetate dehalogenase
LVALARGSNSSMFDDFKQERIDVGDAVLRVRHGGRGTPVMLLHGHPRTHTTWHRVAPLLAAEHTVICPDLRGYGESSKPPTTADHEPYSKRAMAGDCIALARALGHERFAIVGHDRGAYVAFRAALDHPRAIAALAVLDAIPIADALARTDATFAQAWWHWFFLGQTDKPAERLISTDPDEWYGSDREQMGEGNYADYRRAIHDPQTVHAMCEDYRAGLGIDRAHDEADRGEGRQIACPTLVAWSAADDMETLYGDPLQPWRARGDDLRGVRIDSGHHMAEQAPEQLARELLAFLAESPAARR